VRTRIEATKEIIQGKVKGVAEIWSAGKSKLAKEMSLVFLSDVLSYYLAMHGKKNPDKTANIDTLKAVLKEKLNMQEKIEKGLV
jgi:glucose/mannose-6-phosphate isomerase